LEGASWTWLGRILGKTDPSQSEKAKECTVKGIKILEEMGIKPWYSEGYLCLGELYADIGKREKALENLKKAEGMFQEMGMDYWLARTQEIIGGYRELRPSARGYYRSNRAFIKIISRGFYAHSNLWCRRCRRLLWRATSTCW